MPDFQQGALTGVKVWAVAGKGAGGAQAVDQCVIYDDPVIAGSVIDGLEIVYAIVILVAVKQLIIIKKAFADECDVLIEFCFAPALGIGDESVESNIGQGLLMCA